MKRCISCTEFKPVEEFNKDKQRVDGYNVACKCCTRLRAKRHYNGVAGEQIRKRSRTVSTSNRKILSEMKSTLGCKLCKENDPVCLGFHHTDPREKDFTIAHYMACSIEKLKMEIQKCVCLCSNCHKKVHAGKIELK